MRKKLSKSTITKIFSITHSNRVLNVSFQEQNVSIQGIWTALDSIHKRLHSILRKKIFSETNTTSLPANSIPPRLHIWICQQIISLEQHLHKEHTLKYSYSLLGVKRSANKKVILETKKIGISQLFDTFFFQHRNKNENTSILSNTFCSTVVLLFEVT